MYAPGPIMHSPQQGLSDGKSPRSIDFKVHVYLLLTQLSFAGFHVAGKLIFRELSPLALAGLRVGCATPFLLLFAWQHDRILPRPKDLPILALLGLLGVCLNQGLFVLGLHRTTATNASILMPSIPVFAVAISALSGIERVGWRRLLGILLAVAGAAVMLDSTAFSLADRHTVGNLMVLANCLSYATFLVLQRPVVRRLPWRTVIAWSFLFGSLGILAMAWPDLSAVEFSTLSSTTWWLLGYVVAFPTIFAYATNTWAVHRSTPTLVAVYITLQPLVTAGLARVVLGEPLGLPQVLGFVLIAAGLVRVSTAIARETRGTPTALME